MPVGNEPAVMAFLALLRIGITIFCVVRAGHLNRSRLGWGLFGFFIPLLALIVILLMKPKQPREEETLASSASPTPMPPAWSSSNGSGSERSFMDRASKKMLRHGPGSPGETAELNAKAYLMFEPDDHDDEWEETFTAIAGMRFQSWMMNRMVPHGVTPETVNQLVERSEGDLACLTFFMMYVETKQFRENILAHENTFSLATEVMYETIQEKTPQALTKSLDAFQRSALAFVRSYQVA